MGWPRAAARSRSVARSGINPVNQNNTDTVKYVDTANTSHSSGERKFGQMAYWFGTGARNHAIHTRPTCRPGYNPAHMTAKSVIASAARLTAVRHRWRVRNKMAEISVPGVADADPEHEVRDVPRPGDRRVLAPDADAR